MRYRAGPFLVSLQTDCPGVISLLADLYPVSEVIAGDRIFDFHIAVTRVPGLRRWWRPQVRFAVDRLVPFEPYPLDHAFPLLEWGLNWCIAMRAHQYLMLHSGAMERGGAALILPATPGSGKSTLSAALAFRGWRLMSDEFGLYDWESRTLVPLPRAVPLKNRSIEVIRHFAPEAYLGPVFPKTRKGDVAHLRPPAESLRRQGQPAEPRWLVFPRYEEQVRGGAALETITRDLAFTRLAHNSFNYHLLGQTGFEALVGLVRRCECYSLVYRDLDDAIARLDEVCSF
jgi:HprK-related kinase A